MINKLYDILNSNDINFLVGEYRGETFFIFDNWDDIEKIGEKNLDSIEWGFSDEYTTCNCCSNIIHLYNYNEVEYIISEQKGEILCDECIKYDDIIENFANSFKKAVPEKHMQKIQKEMVQEKWHEIGEYDFRIDDNIMPKNIIDDLMKKLKNKYDYIFCLTCLEMFGQSAKLYIRRAE